MTWIAWVLLVLLALALGVVGWLALLIGSMFRR